MIVKRWLAWRDSRRPAMDVIDRAPGPSPWHMRGGDPRVPPFEWQEPGAAHEAAGVIALSGRDGVVLLLNFHNYVLVLDADTLLIWHQQAVQSGPTAPVVLRIFRLPDLRPLQGDVASLCRSMRDAGAAFCASGGPWRECAIPTTVASVRQALTFPEPLPHLEELLILCNSSGVDESPEAHRSNLALLLAKPREGVYQLFPQDWFNRAKFDYTFQGVTRVARDPRTGAIHGDGVRIDPFVLDSTLRHRRRWWR